MKTSLSLVACNLVGAVLTAGAATPLLDSWLTDHAGQYARVYLSDGDKNSGMSYATWARGTLNQSLLAYSGVSAIYSSANWVYLRTSVLGVHVMGPWHLNAGHTTSFPNVPINTKALYRIPRSPATNSVHPLTGGGPIGYFVLGWVRDGFPIYGPYGYATATDASSGVRRMTSGYVLRNSQNGADNLIATGRAAIPAWAARVGENAATGPAVSASYPLGRYLEDNAYLGDLTNSVTGQRYQPGVDLNEWNTRWCVTPEFPGGTWAYFVCIAANGTPVFPYNISRS